MHIKTISVYILHEIEMNYVLKLFFTGYIRKCQYNVNLNLLITTVNRSLFIAVNLAADTE